MRDLRSSFPDGRESRRLRLLQRLCLPDTFDRGCLDEIARTAALALDAPVASILVADVDGPWMLSVHGSAVPDLPLEALFVETAGLIVVEDTLDDAHFAGFPAGPRFFAGCNCSSSGGPMVALCVMDRRPRRFDERAAELLRSLAASVRFTLECPRREASRLEAAGARLISPAAHGIRGALTSIRGFSEYLLSQESTESVRRELLGFVHEKADQSASVLAELLELYQLDTAAGSDFEYSTQSLEAMLSDALEPYSDRLEVRIEENLPPIQADARRLRRALANLLKCVSDGPSSQDDLAVRLRRAEQPGFLAITVDVAWNALGRADPRSLCEPFFRLDQADPPGLAVTKKIAELHGGRLMVAGTHPDRLGVTLLLPF